MKHLILGTAGHVDHGKTSIVKALTGIDCDTHKAEKTRGITINLGFAHFDLPDGNSIGIIDVPGHSDFVNTMVAGASGIDLVMMVIAADSGVMPQTIEHLQIMQILGVKSGFVALTKVDLVSEDLLKVAEDEICEFLKGTFLEGSPILQVSSKTNVGMDEIKEFLSKKIGEFEERKKGEIFRLFIDRIFIVKGHGTVVTGSVLSGNVRKEDKVFLLPSEKELRIRRLERHGEEVENVTAGDRASMNLVGLNREDFERGMCLSNNILKPTKMLDAKLTLFRPDRNFSLWARAIFLLGTFQSQARIHLIDTDKLEYGQNAIVQIHLDQPCTTQIGDKFVLRSTSGDFTLGGGEIIDAHPLHHRRRPKKLIEKLQKISEGSIPERIAAEVHKCLLPVSISSIANILNISVQEVREIVSSSLPEEIVSLTHEQTQFLMSLSEKEILGNKIIKNLENYHKRNPLDSGGRRVDELMGIFGISRDSDSENIMKIILSELQRNNKIKRVGNTWAISSHNVELSDQERRQIKFFEDYLENSGMKTPLIADMVVEAQRNKVFEEQRGKGSEGQRDKVARGQRGIDYEEKLKQILQMLVNQGKAYNIDGNFIHTAIIDNSRERILEYLNKRDEGITVAQFRDLVGGNRKICLLMLSQFDGEGITIRSGDFRLITKKGREKLQE